MPIPPDNPDLKSEIPNFKSQVSDLLDRPPEQRLREYKYRFSQSIVFGLPVIALQLWGRALGTTDVLRVATPDEAAAAVRYRLQNKRMLLMVDDVWDEGNG